MKGVGKIISHYLLYQYSDLHIYVYRYLGVISFFITSTKNFEVSRTKMLSV